MPHSDLIARARALSAPLEPLPTGTAEKAPQLKGIKAVLFDVYGTLLISASGDVGANEAVDNDELLIEALKASKFKGFKKEAGVRGIDFLHEEVHLFHARKREEGVEYPEVDILTVWEAVLENMLEEELIMAGWRDRDIAALAMEYECRVNPVWPMPGMKETLGAIHESGRIMGIVSNAQFYTPLILEAFLESTLEDAGFDAACSTWSYRQLEAKPSVALYQRSLSLLSESHGVKPSEVLYVGNDMRNDIWPSQSEGCRTALFAGDARSLRKREDDERCTGIKPDAVVTSLPQVMQLIAGD